MNLDWETFCIADLKKVGLYKYVNDPSFEILLLSVAYDEGPVLRYDITTGDVPQQIWDDIEDPKVIKYAWNAAFERVVAGKILGKDLDAKSWRCTMIRAATMGLPMGLDHAAAALRLDIRKDKEGKQLITYFCKPCKPTKKNGMRTRNYPKHDPEKWARFCSYNVKDVKVEKAVGAALAKFTVPTKEQLLWELDQRINDRGVLLEPRLISQALSMYATYKDKLLTEAGELTGLSNPNSLSKLKTWLSQQLDDFDESDTLNKDDLVRMMGTVDNEVTRRVLEIRQETSKSSIEKYAAMAGAINYDNFARGLLQFYGASRTGRFSGKIIQPQNLVRNVMKLLDFARECVMDGDLDTIELVFGSLSYVLSQLIRTAFRASPGRTLIASDFSQIEARVLAWLAGEHWKLDVFKSGKGIYEATGARMFKMREEDVIDDWRQRAKIGELACGFGGSVGAIMRMWPKHLPMPTEEEAQEIVGRWRESNRSIVKYWRRLNEAAIECVDSGMPQIVGVVTYYMKSGTLFCKLPGGRSLAYPRARITEGRYGPQVSYYGVHPKTYQFIENRLYGGLLCENITQAIARDLLCEKMLEVDALGESIVFHVHDELVIDAPDFMLPGRIKRIHRIMSSPVSWAPGLPIDAKTDTSLYYKKE